MSVLTDHRADPGDDVPATLSSPTDGDRQSRRSTPRSPSATRVDAVPDGRAERDRGSQTGRPLRPDAAARRLRRPLRGQLPAPRRPALRDHAQPGRGPRRRPRGLLPGLAPVGGGRVVGRSHRMGPAGGRPLHDAQLAAHGRPHRARSPSRRPGRGRRAPHPRRARRARAAARRRAPRRRPGRHGGRARRRGRGAGAGAAGYRRRPPVPRAAAWWATPWPTSRRPHRSRSAPYGHGGRW